MPSLPRISETEWEVMRIIWAKAPLSAAEVIEALIHIDPSWHPNTVKTLLNRLVKKKALTFRKEGRAYLYRPLAKESACVAAETESFLDRVFGGSLKPMLAHMVDHRKLSAKQIEELRQLLREGKEE